MDHTEEFTHVSLCAGYGGIDLGLKRVIPNLRTIAFSEIEGYAVANLVSKIEAGYLDAAPIWSDLKTFPWESFRGKVDVISGGFPCQPFSAAGSRKGSSDPRHLFPFIKRGIAISRPSLVFFENVEGIISTKLGDGWIDPAGTPVLLHVLRELERLDFKTTAGIFSAEEIGAPHQRRRVFIMGVSNNARLQKTRTEFKTTRSSESSLDVFPSSRNEKSKEWEPPRVTSKLGYSECSTIQESFIESESDSNPDKIQASRVFDDSILQSKPHSSSVLSKSAVGRKFNGDSDRMDYGDLCESFCNRTDELRLLGNGVIPGTAARAFRTLWRRLTEEDL